MAIDVLEQYLERCEERFVAHRDFYGDLDLDVPVMTDYFRETSDSAFCFWFIFDYQLDDGSYVVDGVLKANPILSAGELRYLEQLRGTAIMPYEVVDVQPGRSIVLRRINDGTEIEVREKTASRTLKRWDMLLTRVNPLGPSGGAEMEAGVMFVPPLVRDEIADLVRCELEYESGRADTVHRFKELGPAFHQIWLSTIVAPRIPQPVTKEGDPVQFVTTRFDVLDADRVTSALNAASELQCEGGAWTWISDHSILATLRLDGSQLLLETHSDPRAERGRQLIERVVQDAVVYRSCDKVDIVEETRKAILSGRQIESRPDAANEIPAEIQDQLHQAYMAKFSQQWLDDQIPALDHQTPRVAARSDTLRPRLVALLKDMENDYLRGLAGGKPAFDPTWMWDELELTDDRDAPRIRHSVRLAHESLEQLLPGTAQLVQSVTERLGAAGKDPTCVAVTQDELRSDAQVQQWLRDGAGCLRPDVLLTHLEFYCNYEMQRRKTFWVDESLAWMLAHTQVDAESRLFRLPFSSYVLVYTDRHMLGLAERALANDPVCPLRGQMLAVLCAYVTESGPDGSQVKVALTFDAFAGQPPHLMSWELQIDRQRTLDETLGDALARAKTTAAGMFRPLLDAVVNTTLYTTSAGVNVEQHRARKPNREAPASYLSGEDVYYLPGKIKISHMRKLQQVARGPHGQALMHRYMVRGHWRRPNPNWTDQSLRWIEPYWRGPSLASIVEREYRVTP